MAPRVQSGLDRIARGDPAAVGLVRGRTIGLLAHPASVDARFEHAARVLTSAGANIAALFGPEHGYGGEAQDMVSVPGAREAVPAGMPVYSLYGAREQDLSPAREWLDGLDAIVIDLQDVGSRYYTFVWTAALMLRAAAAAGIETIVLDRANPLGGDVIEGAPQRPGYRSFVGLYDVSVRHGMTIGEICELVRQREGLDQSALSVVRMTGWRRGYLWDDTGLAWVMPSPNMPAPDTALVYPGGCLLEGTNLSDGRGTTRPFEILGAPFLDGRRLASAVAAKGCVLRPLTFSPTFHKHVGHQCSGVQVHVTDSRGFRPYATYLRLIAATHSIARDDFAWRTGAYEFVADRPAIDLLTGGRELREVIDKNGEADVGDVISAEEAGAARFREERKPYLLYAPKALQLKKSTAC